MIPANTIEQIMPGFKDMSNVIACADCSSATLHYDGKMFSCQKCGRCYPFDDGVLIMADKGGSSRKGVVEQELQDWDGNAEFYVREAESPLYRLLNYYKVRTFELNDKDEQLKVLDFGAGTGFFSKQILSWGHIPLTLDFSLSMLRHGREVYGLPLPIQAVSPPLPFKSEVFDAVVGNGVLHHCKAQDSMLETIREIHRVLRPGGVFLLYDRNGSFLGRNLHHFVISVKNLISRGRHFSSSASTHEPDFNEVDIKSILDAGFRIEKRRYVSTICTFMGIVVSNTIEYMGLRRFSSILRACLWPLLALSERLFPYKCFTVEQCVRFKKVES